MTPTWMTRRACGPDTAHLFFPPDKATGQATKAKAICARCPVAGQCLNYALEHRIMDGIWGGTSHVDRRRIRRNRRKQTAA